jgi:polar amino acid transport system substrate-binding protein
VARSGSRPTRPDPAYPPQSFQNNQGEYKGFDINVAEEIARRMGVEVQWLTPS